VSEIEALGRKATNVQCDVSKQDQIDELVRRTREELGPIDLLEQCGSVPDVPQMKNSNSAKSSPAMAALRGPPPLCSPPLANFVRRAGPELIGEWRDARFAVGWALRRRSWWKFIVL
jgi:NAD(P)-dependent dehydrogenase (short-subunit alcohol dehydrogenase family)